MLIAFKRIINILIRQNKGKIRVANKFKEIKEKNKGKIFAIDGGSSIVCDGGSWMLCKIRVSCVGYNGKKVYEKKEFDDSVLIFIENNQIKATGINANTFEIIIKNKPEKIKFEELHNYVRKHLELKTALKKINELGRDETLLIDGLFKCDANENKDLMKKLLISAEKKRINLVGLAKTSRIYTKNGRNVMSLVKRRADELGLKEWVYSLGKNEFIVRLNKISDYVFRMNCIGNLKEILEVLSFYSQDLTIPGYPYPLIRADYVARISKNEVRQEKNKFRILLKKQGLKDFVQDLLSQDFHRKLDERRYKK